MRDSIRVSVVIPVHNGAHYIEGTISSVLASDLRELEIIVIDDGSTDTSASLVRSFHDSRITLLQQVASGGPSRPRNVGLMHAQASYIAFLDADDELRPDKLSSTVEALDRHPEAGFAFADFEHIDPDGRIIDASVVAEARLLRHSKHGPRELLAFDSAPGAGARPAIEKFHWYVRRRCAQERARNGRRLRRKPRVFRGSRFVVPTAHHSAALYRDAIGHSFRLAPGSLTYELIYESRAIGSRFYVGEKGRRSKRSERRQLDRLIAESGGHRL